MRYFKDIKTGLNEGTGVFAPRWYSHLFFN
jgi:hypothetical protein